MFEYLLNENTVIQAAYQVGQQAKVFNYEIFSAWKSLMYLLYLDSHYSMIKLEARKSYLRGYYSV